MKSRKPAAASRERGQILAMTGMALIALCALVALAVDTGFFFDYRRRMQTAADAAAMAGAEELRQSGDDTKIIAAGRAAAASNWFTDAVDSTQVIINHPPQSGFYAGNSGYVEATVSQPRSTLFVSILGFQTATVNVRAVAGSDESRNCIYVLNRTVSKALNLNGNFAVTASCGVVVDSSNSDALDDSGGACMTVTGGAEIDITGHPGGNSSCLTPTPKTDVPAAPDPLAGRAAPTVSCSSCDHTNFKVNPGDTMTLSPGVYCGGITIGGGAGNPSTATFQSGLYVLCGGGLSVNGGIINGSGVTFYNTGTTSGSTKYGSITIQGNVTGTLTAPTSGSMESILFFGDRALPGQTDTVNGNTGLTLEGTFYLSKDSLKFAGGESAAGAAHYTVLITDTLVLTGGATFNSDFSSLADGSPIKTVALGE